MQCLLPQSKNFKASPGKSCYQLNIAKSEKIKLRVLGKHPIFQSFLVKMLLRNSNILMCLDFDCLCKQLFFCVFKLTVIKMRTILGVSFLFKMACFLIDVYFLSYLM